MNNLPNLSDIDVDISIAFYAENGVLPSPNQQCMELWRFAKLLEHAGIDIDQWFVSGDPEIPAFAALGPTSVAIESTNDTAPEDEYQTINIWNRREGKLSASFSSWYTLGDSFSMFKFYSDGMEKLYSYNILADILESSLKIWPALYIKLAPYKYSTKQRIFPDRPAVGWMLYLQGRIEAEQVPEARMIRHTKDKNGTEGTIIISVIDGPFDVNNPEHVKVANAIEIRLADQGLLPRYADL